MRLLLDTNVISDFIRGFPQVQTRLRAARPVDLAVSTITVMEIEYGLARNPQRATRIGPVVRSLLESVNVLEYDQGDARESGAIRAALESLGRPIGLCDSMLAGTARNRDLVVITHNTSEFSRVDGLRVGDWRD